MWELFECKIFILPFFPVVQTHEEPTVKLSWNNCGFRLVVTLFGTLRDRSKLEIRGNSSRPSGSWQTGLVIWFLHPNRVYAVSYRIIRGFHITQPEKWFLHYHHSFIIIVVVWTKLTWTREIACIYIVCIHVHLWSCNVEFYVQKCNRSDKILFSLACSFFSVILSSLLSFGCPFLLLSLFLLSFSLPVCLFPA